MKVVHLTDLHVQTIPRLTELGNKRLIGSANLFLLGRSAKFSAQVQAAAVATARALEPDLVIITGDLTAQALDSEFEAARALLDPLLERTPAVIIPGNHDTYVAEPFPGARMRRWFGDWMGAGSPHLHIYDEVAVLTVETCRSALLSSGHTPPEQLEAAARLLAQLPAEARPFVFLALHYPLRGRRGEPYGPWTRALSNAAVVERFIAGTDRIDAVVHGHEHHGFRTTVPGAAGPVTILNPGASGYSLITDQNRTAHLNVYTVEGRQITELRRLRWDGRSFDDEPGGAYATGR